MTGRAWALVAWLIVWAAVGALVALRGDLETALTAWACAVAIPAVVWYYEVRGRGKTDNE